MKNIMDNWLSQLVNYLIECDARGVEVRQKISFGIQQVEMVKLPQEIGCQARISKISLSQQWIVKG